MTDNRQEKSIALVAHSQRTRDVGPWGNDDWFVLGLNNVHRFVPRIDCLIQIHTPEYLAAHPAYSKEDLALYETTKIPVIAQRHYDQWPSSIPMTLGALECRYGKNKPGNSLGTPWVSTMTYMAGLAMLWIEEGEFPEPFRDRYKPARRFGMWGFDSLDDYAQQGPSVAFLAGIAYARDIEFIIPKASGFLRQPFLYGYEAKANALRRRQIDTRKAEIEGGLKQIKQKIDQRNSEMAQLQGRAMGMQAALAENEWQRVHWTEDFDDDSPAATGPNANAQMALSRVARGGADEG